MILNPLDLVVFFGAWFFQAFTGFGAGIFIVGVLSLVYDPRVVVVSSTLVNLLGTAAMSILLMRRVKPRFDILSVLILGSVPGIFVGAKVLLALEKETLRLLIGVFILFLGIYDLLVQKGYLSRFSVKESPLTTFSVGFLGGFFAGLVGMGGPPPVVYLNQVLEDVEEFKSTLTLFFTSNIIFRVFSYTLEGGTGFFDMRLILAALVGVPLGVYFGLTFSRRVHPKRLKMFISVSVVLLGIMLVAQAGLW